MQYAGQQSQPQLYQALDLALQPGQQAPLQQNRVQQDFTQQYGGQQASLLSATASGYGSQSVSPVQNQALSGAGASSIPAAQQQGSQLQAPPQPAAQQQFVQQSTAQTDRYGLVAPGVGLPGLGLRVPASGSGELVPGYVVPAPAPTGVPAPAPAGVPAPASVVSAPAPRVPAPAPAVPVPAPPVSTPAPLASTVESYSRPEDQECPKVTFLCDFQDHALVSHFNGMSLRNVFVQFSPKISFYNLFLLLFSL
jgi:hypothetical protein